MIGVFRSHSARAFFAEEDEHGNPRPTFVLFCDAITQALAAAREDERRKIVEWLRWVACEPPLSGIERYRLHFEADRIEAQEHNVTPSGERRG